jgi:hypothetical protein
MGDLTTSLILLTTTFLLGTLAVHWTADHLLLWQSPITRASLLSAHGYYAETLGHLSVRALAALYALGGAAVLACCVKIAAGRESNWLFDGASLCESGGRVAGGGVQQQCTAQAWQLMFAVL